jgi:hypothetical protein
MWYNNNIDGSIIVCGHWQFILYSDIYCISFWPLTNPDTQHCILFVLFAVISNLCYTTYISYIKCVKKYVQFFCIYVFSY